jgi:hypothetical protein|eukprot:scaffold3777_cov214-Alexandrium_tamarense.AAC.19
MTLNSYILEPNNDIDACSSTSTGNCTGTAEDWIYVSFGGMWIPEHIPWNILYLVGAIVVAQAITLFGLTTKNFLAT